MNESYWQPSPFSRRLSRIYEVIHTVSSSLIDSSRKELSAGGGSTAPPGVNNPPSDSLTCRVGNGGGPNVD